MGVWSSDQNALLTYTVQEDFISSTWDWIGLYKVLWQKCWGKNVSHYIHTVSDGFELMDLLTCRLDLRVRLTMKPLCGSERTSCRRLMKSYRCGASEEFGAYFDKHILSSLTCACMGFWCRYLWTRTRSLCWVGNMFWVTTAQTCRASLAWVLTSRWVCPCDMSSPYYHLFTYKRTVLFNIHSTILK